MGSAGAGTSKGSFARASALLLAVMAMALCLGLFATSAGAKVQTFDFCPSGSLGGQCIAPRGVAVNLSGNGGVAAGTVYVGDNNNRRIQSFTAAGAFIRAWGHDVETGGGTGFEICEVVANCKAGTAGGAAGQFSSGGLGGGIAVDQATGEVYVIDAGNFRVQEFSATGAFKRTWGADVDSTGGTGFEVCEIVANCKSGVGGEAGGMFNFGGALAGIATDSSGNVYVADAINARLQKFTSAGSFLAAGGTDVDSGGGTGYEVCTVAANCKAGAEGSPFAGSNNPQHLTVSPAGQVYASDTVNHQVYRFSSALALDVSFAIPVLAGRSPRALAFDPATGRLFLTVREDPTIYDVDPASEEVVEETFGEATTWFGTLAVGLAGRLYASPSSLFSSGNYIRAFDPGTVPAAVTSPNTSAITGTSATLNGWVNPHGSLLTECRFDYGTTEAYDQSVPCAESAAAIGNGTEPVKVHADVSGLELGTVYHFRLHVAAAGEDDGLDQQFQTVGPNILAAWSEDVTVTEAALKADVDPEGAPTTFHFDYGTTATYGSQSPELGLGEDSAPHEASFFLDGLEPDTTYHYRIVATSPDGVRIGFDHEFHTYRPFVAETECPNQDRRIGPAANLPDCRGYEMVSPVDKGGGDIVAKGGVGLNREAAYRQAALDGESVTYTSSTAFGDALRGTAANQYLATRGATGWSTHGLNPPQGTTVFDPEGSLSYDLSENFLAFTPDLCAALLRDHNLTPLDEDAIAGFTNLYQRGNCASEADSYRAITTGPAPTFSLKPDDLEMYYATYSADGSHVVFGATAALASTPVAAAGTKQQLYDYDLATGTLHLVSVLPAGEGGAASTEGSALGSSFEDTIHGRESPLAQAVSADGSRIFWTAGEGKLFVRVNGTTTLKIASNARFLTAAADGSAAVYSQGANLREFDVDKALAAEAATSTIAGEAGGAVGAAEDLSRLYFTSGEELAAGAVGGELNLYLREGGATRLVAVLADEDGAGAVNGAQVDSASPFNHASHASADGRYLAFMSTRPLTGYDSVDAQTREPSSEVFRYDALAEELVCVSCRASRARPEGRVLDPLYHDLSTAAVLPKVQTAAWLPTSEWGNFAKRALSEDGNRIYFNAYDALVPEDTDVAQDVYQWEAEGTGGCDAAASRFSAPSGGCLELLSTGKSNEDSELLDASADGGDVFFTTAGSIDSLRDPGSIDVYDAREGGGFEPPPPGPPECVGDACQPVPTPPAVRTPASEAFEGPENPTAKPAKRCGKGKRKVRRGGKTRCVRKRKGARKQHRADHDRRAKR